MLMCGEGRADLDAKETAQLLFAVEDLALHPQPAGQAHKGLDPQGG